MLLIRLCVVIPGLSQVILPVPEVVLHLLCFLVVACGHTVMSSRSASQFVSLCCFVSVRCHFYLLLHFILSPCCRIVSVCGRFASLSEFNGGNLRHRAPSVQGHLILYLEGLFSNPSTKLAGQQAPDQSSGLVPGPEYNTAVFVCAAADCSSGQLHFYIFDHVWILKIHQQLMNSCSNQHES